MTSRRYRLGYAGTPELAATILKALVNEDAYTIDVVYTQPDRPAGRGRKLTPSAVKIVALANDLPIRQPESGKGILPQELQQLDLLVVAAYGILLPAKLLDQPRLGCINVHTSLLPRWRGAAPIQRAIAAGDRESGITIMQMDSGLDTGDILLQRSCPIYPDDNAGKLHDRLAQLGAESLLAALPGLFNETAGRRPQDNSQATYAAKITKEEASIDWQLPATTIECNIRAFNPFPIAYTELQGITMRVWEAEVIAGQTATPPPGVVVSCDAAGLVVTTGAGLLRITRIQLPGKRPISISDFLNGHPGFHNPSR